MTNKAHFQNSDKEIKKMTSRRIIRTAFFTAVMSTSALALPGAGSAYAQSVPSLLKTGTVAQAAVSTVQSRQKLNVGLAHGGFTALPNQVLTFKTYWNYDRFVFLGEVRVYKGSDKELSTPLEVIPVKKGEPTQWTPKASLGDEFIYVLRVYGHNGLYDETAPRLIRLSDRLQTAAEASPSSINIFRQDNTAVRHIVISAAAVQPQVLPDVPAQVVSAKQVHTPAPLPPVAAPPPPVVQTAAPAPAKPSVSPFKVSVEEPVDTALSFGPEDIYMSYDGLKAVPLLNVGLADAKGAASVGETITFNTYWNYNHWIDRAEIRIFDEEDNLIQAPIASLLVGLDGHTQWTVPAAYNSSTYSYSLRVYDRNGKFDETRRKYIRIVENAEQGDEYPVATPIYGEDNTDRRNIQINGGTVTVSAAGIDPAHVAGLSVFGKPVIADDQGDFAIQQILPAGYHDVELSYLNDTGEQVTINRNIDIPKNEFFFVGLGDLTVGHQGGGARDLVEAGGEDFDETFVLGRAAFYLKGKVQGKYLITASLDTTEDDISNIFSNLNDRDPHSLLRRLDPDKFYPIYGDDSTFVEDAPTQGRFYVRIERGDDHIVWGNFLTNIKSTEFSQIDRGLYGAKLELNSDRTTSHGERRSRLTLFAADPGTIPGRDEFRGTGGSVFFLENQDLTIGSERVRIEIRDKDTGLVLETRELRPFVDYDIDYIQGRVVLAQPLSSTLLSDQVVRDGNLSGDNAHLVVRYEFTPGLDDIGGFTVGGRAEAWLGDNVRVGVTGQQEETGDIDQTLLGADVVVRATEHTYIKGEFSNTNGQGFGETASLDGGFTFSDLESTDTDADANAYRVEGAVGLNDISNLNGQVTGYYEDIEAGFSAPGRLAQADTERFGASAKLDLSKDGRSQVAVDYEQVDIEGGLEETTVSADLRVGVTDRLIAGVGVRYNDIEGSAVGRNGERTDIGAELEFAATQDLSTYLFGQGTVSQRGTIGSGERYGGGARVQISDTLQLNGEVSGGSGGLGALGGVTVQRKDGEEYYLNYTLDAERTEPGVDGTNTLFDGQNTLTVGGRKRFNSAVSVFGEERRSFGNTAGLTHAYGIDFNLAERWTLGASFEIGEVETLTQIVDREAVTVSAGYGHENVNVGAAFEWREDTIDGINRRTWFLRSNASAKITPSLRALLRFDRAESNSDAGAFFDGEFTELQVAGAYRPVENDRFNALLRYTYYEDLAGAEQVSNSGQTGLPAQRSNIFSLDAQYRLTNWLTIGGKYGYRNGEVSLTRVSDDFVDSTAQLGILRADIHFIKKWDAVLEGRILDVSAADDRRAGFLGAIYRHVGENAKIGVGYNFTDFSDDLTDLTFDDSGVFLNLIAKF